MEGVVSEPSALSLLTEVQRDAVIATAAAYLLDPEDLAAEWLPMLADQPTDPVIRPEPGDELAVKGTLTPRDVPTEPFVVTFTTASGPDGSQAHMSADDGGYLGPQTY